MQNKSSCRIRAQVNSLKKKKKLSDVAWRETHQVDAGLPVKRLHGGGRREGGESDKNKFQEETWVLTCLLILYEQQQH